MLNNYQEIAKPMFGTVKLGSWSLQTKVGYQPKICSNNVDFNDSMRILSSREGQDDTAVLIEYQCTFAW